MKRAILVSAAAALLLAPLAAPFAAAHGVEGGDASFLESNDGLAVFPFMYLGAKHMVTGYDHLLFLVGVIFFLYRLRDVLLYVSLFTVGHSLTLLGGALGGVRASAFLVDAVIGLSIVASAPRMASGIGKPCCCRSLASSSMALSFAPRSRIAAAMALPLLIGAHLSTWPSLRVTYAQPSIFVTGRLVD